MRNLSKGYVNLKFNYLMLIMKQNKKKNSKNYQFVIKMFKVSSKNKQESRWEDWKKKLDDKKI